MEGSRLDFAGEGLTHAPKKPLHRPPPGRVMLESPGSHLRPGREGRSLAPPGVNSDAVAPAFTPSICTEFTPIFTVNAYRRRPSGATYVSVPCGICFQPAGQLVPRGFTC